MAKKQSDSNLAVEGNQVDPMGGSVDKIRDILFGNQMQEYERKFSKLEELLSQKLSDFREENRKRLDSLEEFVKAELDSLESRLQTEKKERAEAVKDLEGELKSTNKALDQKTDSLAEQATRTEKALREQILAQSKVLRDEIQTCRDDLTKLLNSSAHDLEMSKVDRHGLAQMLTKVAFNLSQDNRDRDAS